MLATSNERPTPRAFPLWPDPDSNREREAEPVPGWPAPAGFPSPADDGVARSLGLDDHLIRDPESTFLVRVAGEALAEIGLRDGDLLVMDRATPPLAGNVVLAVVDGVSGLARLGRDARGRLRVRAAGTDLGRPLDDAIAIAGVARWAIRRLWPGRLSS